MENEDKKELTREEVLVTGYKVSFKKFKDLVNFKPAYTPKEGSIEIFEALKTGKLQESLKTKTVEWYKHLLNSRD